MGLSRISWSDPRTQLGWRFALPAWAWALIVVGAVAVAGRSYTRLLGSRGARFALAAVRALIILLIAALIAGPMAVLPQEQVEPDWLLVLVDRSASMALRDIGGSEPMSRDQQMRRALAQHADVFEQWGAAPPGDPNHGRRLIWLGFDAGTYQIDPPLNTNTELSEPRGQQTLLRTAIEQALQRVAGRPVSGLVLLTDGRSPQVIDADLIRRLRQGAIGVYPVPLGAAEPPIDLALDRIDAPEKAMIDDIVPVTVWVQTYPRGAKVNPASVRAKLIDAQSGQVLDEKTASEGGLDPGDAGLRLTGRRAVAGQATWRVEVEYAGDGALQGAERELVTDNNAREISLEFVDQPIRVLYVEGYPRWEYRYLKNLLIREDSITSSIMLIEADREFAQEGDVPIARLPIDRKEIDPYDVIVIGDVAAPYWSAEQMTLIADHVSERGAGLLWIGGERYTPRTYDLPPLADLLPMRRPAMVERAQSITEPIAMTPTVLAEQLSVLRLRSAAGATSAADEPAPAWPKNLPPLYWAQDLGALKPTAEVLAEGYPASLSGPRPSSASVPLVVRMRYGAGQVLYVATDELWRWRFGRGDLYFDQFWVQLVQMLGRGRLQAMGAHRAWMTVSHKRVAHDAAVVVELTIEDPLLLRRDLSAIAVRVERTSAPGQGDLNPPAQVDQIELLPVAQRDGSAPDEPQRFTATWTPGPAAGGTLMLRVVEPALADLGLVQQIEVTRPDDEMLEPAADHDRLAQLAEQTGGQVIAPDGLDQLPQVVPNRARKTPADISEPLWRSPLALIAAVALLTVEWIGRKVIRLV